MSLCHQAVLVGEVKAVVAAFVVSRENGCAQCSEAVAFQTKGSISFLQRGWEPLKPDWEMPRLFWQPCRDWSLFVALLGLFFGFLCWSLCFFCFLKYSELFELMSTLDKLSTGPSVWRTL